MVDLVEARPAEGPALSGKRRRRRWAAAVAAVVLLSGGVITGFAVSFHYLHAPILTTFGGGWVSPADARVKLVQSGPNFESIAPLTPGKWETFAVDLGNPSDVTQTILGLTDAAELGDAKLNAEPERLTIAPGVDPPTAPFGTSPVTLRPHQTATIQLSILANKLNATPCRTERWDGISLQVRVGAFTRTENVSFYNNIWELRAPGKC